MMKFNIILIIVFALNSNLFSQTLFSKRYYSKEDNRSFRAKEDNQGNYIVSGVKFNSISNLARPFVYKINKLGHITDSAFYFSNINHDIAIQDVIPIRDYYIFIGFITDNQSNSYGPNDSSMFYIKTDTNLNIIDTAFYHVVDGEDIVYGKVDLDFDSNIVVVGYYYDTFLNHKGSFIYKISMNGDSLSTNILPINSRNLFINSMIDSNSYYVFSSSSNTSYLYKFNYSLVFDNKYPISNLTIKNYSPILNKDSSYFTSGYKYYSHRHFSIIKSTIRGTLMNNIEFGVVDSNNYPALYDGLCRFDKNLYFFGSIMDDNQLPLHNGQNRPSRLYLAKLDTGLNIIWEKYYGGNNFYTAMNVIPTSDGGFLLNACVDDINDISSQLDVFLVKLDSNGNTTWTQNIAQPQVKLMLYPNPVSNQLNLQLISPNQSIRSVQVFDIQGKEVLNKQLNSKQMQLDVGSLSNGVYLIKGQTNTGLSFSRKFVKE